MPITNKRYGWRPSRPDQRNLKFFPKNATLQTLPEQVDMRGQCPPIVDQKSLGSCTANAADGLARFLMIKLGLKEFPTSRLATYYWERVLEGTVNDDSGASILDSVKVMNTNGMAHESIWWYNVAKFKAKPNKKVIADAAKHKIGPYYSVAQDLKHMKSCLADGYPILIGFSVYESFESDEVTHSGIVSMPKSTEQLLGGHAVMVVGYDDVKKWWIVRNSWGADWGDHGYFYMPYEYLINTDLSDDFWTSHQIAAN